MWLLALSIAAFAVVHLVSAIPRAKAYWRGLLGKGYGPAYGVASLLMLVLSLAAFRRADVVALYDPPAWGRHANFALTLIAFIFVGISLFRGSWRNRVKYPVAVAVTFWALGHLLANGDGRTTLFFAGFWGVALLHMFLASRLVNWRKTDERGGHNTLAVLFGIALYGVAIQLHASMAGVPVIDIAGLLR